MNVIFLKKYFDQFEELVHQIKLNLSHLKYSLIANLQILSLILLEANQIREFTNIVRISLRNYLFDSN